MTDKAKEFLKKVSEDEALHQKFEELAKEGEEEKARASFVALAQEEGYDLEIDDFAKAQGEVDDAELASVSGGWKQCVCVAGGVGEEDQDGDRCVCVALGSGAQKDAPHDKAPYTRCLCVLGGYGDGLIS